jgi:diguanylate cyclase (GGDEF)-like protein
MSSTDPARTGASRALTPPLARALDQSEQVKDKVQEAAADLADVNAVLKEDLAKGVPAAQVRSAVKKSEAVEIKVLEAALELVDVNHALADEVAEREALEARVSLSRAAEEQARHAALHDAVTALPNGTLFGDRLELALEQARRHDWRLAVMFLDLDDFKRVNDTHGHDVGDLVLQRVAQHLSASIRGGDSVARRGGDEFLVLMLELRDDADAMAFAEALVERISEETVTQGIPLRIGASIGVAIFPDDGGTAELLLKYADTAMYAAKTIGRRAIRATVPAASPRPVPIAPPARSTAQPDGTP